MLKGILLFVCFSFHFMSCFKIEILVAIRKFTKLFVKIVIVLANFFAIVSRSIR